MPYLGNHPTANFATVTKDTFSGNASTTAFTLSKPATTNGVAVYVENVRQIPTTAYSVSGTTLTFTGTPPSGTNNIYVMHHNTPVSTATHPAAQDLTAVNGTMTGTLAVTGTSTLTGATTVGGTSNLTIANGNLVVGTSGKGIDFSVNTASSVTGTSNQDELLDHYEEGYFTPTIYGSSGSAGSQQINGQEGRYVKIGKLVYITLYFYLQNGGAGSWSGTNRFGGLPFTNGISNRQALSIGSDGLNGDEITFTIAGSSAYGHVVDMYTGTATNYSSFITGYSIQMSGCYYTT